jgi:hypothetical protein
VVILGLQLIYLMRKRPASAGPDEPPRGYLLKVTRATMRNDVKARGDKEVSSEVKPS